MANDNSATKNSNAVPMLSCQGIWKVFGAKKSEFEQSGGPDMDDKELSRRGWTAAVRDASFDVARGEVFVIMGLSGSGKSTVVRCLSRLIEPTSGDVFVEGQDLLAASEAQLLDIRRQKMGMVFQHFALLPNRDVLRNVAFPLQVQNVERSKREERARVASNKGSALRVRWPVTLRSGFLMSRFQRSTRSSGQTCRMNCCVCRNSYTRPRFSLPMTWTKP